MSAGPVPGPGRDGNPARHADGPDHLPEGDPTPDWMDDETWAASLAARVDEDEPPDPEQCPDPADPPSGAQDLAWARELGQAFGFASGMALDAAPGCAALAAFADAAAGDDDRYAGASDDELTGAIRAWDRVEAHASARKHAAVAELIRRRPDEGCGRGGPAGMPESWDEFTADELADALAESRWAAATMLELTRDLEVKLPGTAAAFRYGTLRTRKAAIIARACELLDPGEARAAEALVLGRAATLTPGGLRAAIARAVMEVAPDKARKRREAASRDARVERWPEDSGNAALAGRELPPDEVLAADQRISWWARQLKDAGLDGDMDQLRARAFLDIMLSKDSRPVEPAAADRGPADGRPEGEGLPGGVSGGEGTAGGGGTGQVGPQPPPGPVPVGFIGRITLTVPLATVLELADRPGEVDGMGPVDPWLARDLAAAAAWNPKTTWCITVTDGEGAAIGHGCARSATASGSTPGARAGPATGPPGFAFTAAPGPGPAGGCGIWHLTIPAMGRQDLVVAIEPVPLDDCDHRRQSRGHDPGVMLRHLTEVRHATCTAPSCRRPTARCDFDHSVPYEAGGRTCMCNGGPKCRHDHRRKQHPRWRADQPVPGTFRWTAPSGRTYLTQPTRYPI